MGVVAHSDLRRTLARHLQLSAKSIRTSCSNTSTSLSIDRVKRKSESESERKEVCMKQYRKNIGVLENSRDSVGPRKASGLAIWQNLCLVL